MPQFFAELFVVIVPLPTDGLAGLFVLGGGLVCSRTALWIQIAEGVGALRVRQRLSQFPGWSALRCMRLRGCGRRGAGNEQHRCTAQGTNEEDGSQTGHQECLARNGRLHVGFFRVVGRLADEAFRLLVEATFFLATGCFRGGATFFTVAFGLAFLAGAFFAVASGFAFAGALLAAGGAAFFSARFFFGAFFSAARAAASTARRAEGRSS